MVPVNPFEANAGGWKGNYTFCMNYKGDQFVQCIEKQSYSSPYHLTNRSSATVKLHYLSKFTVMCHNIHIEKGVDMKGSVKSSFRIPINSSLDNKIMIWDAKMDLHSFTSPDMIPTISFLRIRSQKSLIVYMKVNYNFYFISILIGF